MASIQKPGAAKPPESPSDDETPEASPKPVSPRILSTALSRAIVISTVLAIAAIITPLLVAHRYTMASGARGETPVVYRLNTLTGQMSLCSPTQCAAIPEKSPETN